MENILLSADLLRLAKLNEESAKDMLLDTNEEGEAILKPDATAIFAKQVLTRMEQERNDKLGQGKKSMAQEVEKVLSPLFSKFGIQSDKDVINGISQLAEKLSDDSYKEGLSKLTEEEIKKHPLFQQKLNTELATAKQEAERIKQEYEGLKASIAQRERDQILITKVEQALEAQNAAFVNRSAQVSYFYKALDRDNIHINDNGQVELLDADGIALRNPQTKQIYSFNEYVLSKWLELGYGVTDAPPGSPPTPKGKGGSMISSIAQAQEALLKEKDPQKKAEIMKKMAELMRTQK
jgi:hypothetical protein